MNLALTSPTYDDLIVIMSNQRRLLEQLLFKHAEISMLIAAGEHRFVGRALDEALEVEIELGATELIRAMTAAGLDEGNGGRIGDLIAGAPDDVAEQLGKLAGDMNRMLAELERYRRQASAWAGERAQKIDETIARFGAQTYSPVGS